MDYINNIVECTRLTVKVVIVLSLLFLECESCLYVSNLCKMLSEDLRMPKGSLIPICLDLEEIPDILDNITYLKASLSIDDHWWTRFPEALISRGTMPPPTVFNCSEDGCVVRVAEFDSAVQNDTEKPRLLDIVLLTDDRLVVSDANNIRLKLFNMCGQSLHQLQLPSWSPQMCKIDGSSIAVCIPYNALIMVIKLSDGELTEDRDRSIKVGGKCNCVAFIDMNTVVVGFKAPPKVIIMDVHGKELKIFPNTLNGEIVLREPCFIQLPDSNTIVLTDERDRRIICYSKSGDILPLQKRMAAEYYSLNGIVCGKRKNLVAVDTDIRLLTGLGSKIQLHNFIDEIVDAKVLRGLAFNFTEDLIAVTIDTKVKEIVRVFKIL